MEWHLSLGRRVTSLLKKYQSFWVFFEKTLYLISSAVSHSWFCFFGEKIWNPWVDNASSLLWIYPSNQKRHLLMTLWWLFCIIRVMKTRRARDLLNETQTAVIRLQASFSKYPQDLFVLFPCLWRHVRRVYLRLCIFFLEWELLFFYFSDDLLGN